MLGRQDDSGAAQSSEAGCRARGKPEGRTCAPAIPYIFSIMWWPLIGGFIAFVLIAVLIGWWVDPDRRRDVR
jgi:hypothetical protein